ERVAPNDLGELVARPDDDVDVEPEPVGDQALDLACHLFGRRAAREDDVPALEVGLHLAEPGLRERLAELRHRGPVAGPDVAPAQQHDLAPDGERLRQDYSTRLSPACSRASRRRLSPRTNCIRQAGSLVASSSWISANDRPLSRRSAQIRRWAGGCEQRVRWRLTTTSEP